MSPRAGKRKQADEAPARAKKQKTGAEAKPLTRRSRQPLQQPIEEPERALRRQKREQQRTGSKKAPPRATRQARRDSDKAQQAAEAAQAAQEEAAAAAAAAAGATMTDRQGGRHEGGDDPHSTLQGLLRRLGAGLEDIFPGTGGGLGGGSRVRAIISQLREDDEMSQLAGLTELCEYLSISTEESLLAFPTEQVVPLLVNFLGAEHNPDIMLLAARALTFLADVFPPAASSIIRHGAVPAFCARLLTIEYIDLAEQTLQALEKLSHDHPSSLLRNGALVAVLSYVDFFQTGVQRVAVATAANMCRGLTTEHADAATSAAPILISLLQYQDAKIVDSACLALARIAEAFARSPDQMEALCRLGLIQSIVQMVGVSEAGSMTSQLQVSTFYGLLKILATMAGGSHVVAEALLQAGISDTLRNLLATSSLLAAGTVSPGNVLRSAEQLGDLVGLAAALLPPIPDAAAAMLQDVPPSPSFMAAGEKQEAAASGARNEECQRAAFLKDNPALLQKFTADLLPLMIKVYTSSVTPQVKRQCLTTLAKMLHFNTADTLAALLEDLPISSLVAALLGARDSTVAAFGMQMAEILMEKLPDIFSQFFLKEGVVHGIEQLAAVQPPPSLPEANEAVADKGKGRRSGGSERGGRPPSQAADKDGGASEGGEVRTPAGDSLRFAVGARARRFNARYFTDNGGRTVGCETEGARLLRDICARLPDPEAIPALFEALAGTGNASVSTFELLSSGCVRALKGYLQGTDLPVDAPDRQQRLLERLGHFAATAVPAGSGGDPPLGLLVSKLLGALAASEKFVVQLNPISPPSTLSSLYGGGYRTLQRTSSSVTSSLAAGLAALSNPFKIRLTRAADEPGLRDYSANMVLIEPLASMSQIEDFLWARVGGAAGSAAAAAAAGGAGDDPRSRQAAARSGAAGAAAEPSVNAAARASAAAAAAVEAATAAAAQAKAAAAAAAAAAEGSRPGGGGNRRGRQPASKEQPIPQRRMTRAQARLAAEAEVAGQGRSGEEAELPAAATAAQRQLAAAREAAAAAEEAAAAALAEAERQALLEEEMLVGGHSGEEDYSDEDGMEIEGGYVEGEDEEYDEEDDEELEGMASHVHDMHLGDGPQSSGGAAAAAAAAAATATAEQQATRQQAGAGAQTYAQATGRGSTGAGGSGGMQQPGQPHLAFYMGSRLLQPGSTIFQAVQQQLLAEAAGGGGGNATGATGGASGSAAQPGQPGTGSGSGDLGSRLWGQVHTITYRSWGAAMRLQEAEAATSVMSPRTAAGAAGAFGSGAAGDDAPESGPHDHDDASTSPLAELLASALPADIQASQDALDALSVLRISEAINRLSPHLTAWLEGRAGRVRAAGAPPPGSLPRDAFLSSKLGPKLNQQLKDVLSICGGALPPWCGQLVRSARFLFPFEARRRFFYCTSFGLARALHYLQQVHASEHGPASAADREAAGNLRIGRVQRQKVRISRRRLLDSAAKVFELYAGAKAQLEIEFFNEVGTGLGPTLEFYTLLSHELQRRSLGIWRHTPSPSGTAADDGTKPAVVKAEASAAVAAAAASGGGGTAAPAAARRQSGPGPLAGELGEEAGQHESVKASELVVAPQGLFPAPLPPGQRGDDSKVAAHFRLLGRAVAKALQDGRLLDLPLSLLFYRLALQRRVDLYDIRRLDASLGTSLERLHAAYHAHAAAGGTGPLLVDGVLLEDLCLTWELPGFPAYPLHPDYGPETPVTTANLRRYLDAVVEATLGAGVSAQVSAFREGFSAIFPLDALAAFYEDEIEAMLCGTGEAWSVDYLAEVIKFDHGYTAQSPAVRFLLEVLSELDAVEQRRFLRFVTGTPRLPPGGLAALQPRLTVVRKLSQAAMAAIEGTSAPGAQSLGVSGGDASVGSVAGGLRHPADGDLPSVMTCANYIKLPPYSSREVLRERLLFAIREGQGSFDLS